MRFGPIRGERCGTGEAVWAGESHCLDHVASGGFAGAPAEYLTSGCSSKIKLERPVDAECSPDGKWWLVGQNSAASVCLAMTAVVEKSDEFLDLTL